MRSSQNVAIVKIQFRSRAMAFLIIAYCFCSHAWERGFAIGNSGTGDPSTLHHEQTIYGEEIHTLIRFVTGYWKTDHNVTLGQLHYWAKLTGLLF